MKVRIKRLDDKAVIPFKKHASDFCYDCVAVSEKEIAPNVWEYGLGISFQLERYPHIDEHKNFAISARPRSSVWKTGMLLSNCVGTIDEDYRGQVKAIFYHVMPLMPRYKVGDRVCQIHIDTAYQMDFEEVEQLTDTERGEGGFGSTGK